MRGRPIKLLVCDDNDFVAESLRRVLRSDATFEWSGWLPSAAALPDAVVDRRPDVVLLELDIPGEDAFEALRRVVAHSRDSRVVIFSGYVRKSLIDRAIADGAAGYVSKDESLRTVIGLIQRAARGETALCPSALTERTRCDPVALLHTPPSILLHAPHPAALPPTPPAPPRGGAPPPSSAPGRC